MSDQQRDITTSPLPNTPVPRWKDRVAMPSQAPEKSGRLPGLSFTVRQRIILTSFAALFLLLICVLVSYLALLPMKTPLIVAMATDYEWPVPPNSWAQEDIQTLGQFLVDQTLASEKLPNGEIAAVSLANAFKRERLTDLARRLTTVVKKTSPHQTILLYVSAHGVVDSEGRPCLLLPYDDPLDSNTWLPVCDLLQKIKEVANGRNLLLILDSNRQLDNWSIGLANNQFAARLDHVVANADVAGLVILNSASQDQIAWASPTLGGSVFGHFLLSGLAGQADSNGNRIVSLHELASYLQIQVDAWVTKHRATHQTPRLCPLNAPDFDVAWSLRSKDLQQLVDRSSRHTPVLPGAEENLEALWRDYQTLAGFHPHHYAPLTWQRIEGELLWLEQAALAGPAYGPAFDRISRDFKARFQRIREEIEPAADSPVRLTAVLGQDDVLLAKRLVGHSLAMAEFLGKPKTPDNAELPPHANPPNYSSDQLSAILIQHHVDSLWQGTSAIPDVLQLHRHGEQLAVPTPAGQHALADYRAHMLVRALLDHCDEHRRMMEDTLFLGPRVPPLEPQRARKLYQDVALVNRLLAESYQIRDRAWRDLPHLAQSVCAESDSKTLLVLFAQVHQLDVRLEKLEQTPTNQATEEDLLPLIAELQQLHQLAVELNQSMDGCLAVLRNEAGPLLDADESPANLGRVAALLSTPLCSRELRSQLFSLFVNMQQRIDGGRVRLPAAETGTALRAHRQWATDLFSAVLNAENAGDAPADRNSLPAMGETLRETLRQAHLSASENLTIVSGPPTDRPPHARNGSSLSITEAERRLRRLVSLQSAWQGDPYQLLQRRHLQHLLLWNCQRALDDFLASTTATAKPYFVDLADTYLEHVEVIERPDNIVRKRIVYLQQLRDRRAAAAQTGLKTTSTDLLLIDRDVEATAMVRVERTPEGQALPPGVASVNIRSQAGPNPSTIRPLPVGVPHEERVREIPISVLGRDLAGSKNMHQATVLYRGHVFPGPLRIQTLSGPQTEIVWHHEDLSRITLHGPHVGPAAIMFVLDCSHSMNEPVAVEVPDVQGQTAEPSKLHVAVAALRTMTERLGERNDTRVGVRLFGHRVGWRTDQADTIVRQQDYPHPIAPTLQPYQDVELLLPLGRFDSITAGQVHQQLDTLKPWGESPIYLSLVEAASDFQGESPQTERRIVVITDGINYQFNPPPEFNHSRSDVEQLCAEQGIRVHIVGFAIPEEEQSEATREFTQLTAKTGGIFTTAVNPSELLRSLEQLVERATYRVVDGRGHVYNAETGETVRIATAAQRQTCRIEAAQALADTMIEGGEALQLTLSRDQQQIQSVSYEADNPVFVALLADASHAPTGYQAGFHQSRWTDGAVEFPVSFQRTDRGIPQRPRAVWIEITPQRRRSATTADRYLFCDANYEPDLPVPLLRCRCLNWPNDADIAEIRLWCFPQELPFDEELPIDAVANKTPPSGVGLELARVPDVRYQVRTIGPGQPAGAWRVRVIQRHDLAAPVYHLRADLFPAPNRVTRLFDAARGVVLNTFDYLGPMPLNPSPRLRFQTRDHYTNHAWRMDAPVTLHVAKPNDVVLPIRIIDPQGRSTTPTVPVRPE